MTKSPATADMALYWNESLSEELLHFLTRRLNCPEVAADLTQETFLRLFQFVKESPPDNARALAYRIAVNLATDYQRKMKVRNKLMVDIDVSLLADIIGELLPGWNVIATYAYTDVRAIKSNADNEATRYGAVPVGERFFNVPRNTASFWNTYEFQASTLKGLKFGGGVTVRDGQTGCCDYPAGTIAGYATVDLLASYSLKVGKTKVTTQLNINNLLDKHYYTGLLSSGINAPCYTSALADFGQPRIVMGSINVQF